MSKELYEATIEYTKDYNGESWIATISDEKYIDMDTFERVKADLEAKLAEKDKAIENWQTMYESVMQTCHNDKEEIERLNKQLANSEKEIESYEHELEVYKQNDNIYARNMNRLAIRHNQDKISFAVEQLEKVKEFVKETSGIVGHDWRIDRFRVLEQIDDQIKAIKGEK